MRIEVEVRGQRQEIKNAVYSAQQSENCLECAFDFITPECRGLLKRRISGLNRTARCSAQCCRRINALCRLKCWKKTAISAFL